MRRVVVTGMGMVTPLGRDLESTWSALLAGKSGVGPITLFDARTFPTRIAAEVKDFRLDDYLDDSARWAEHSRNSKFALAAATMAIKDSGLLETQARAEPQAVRRLPRLGRRPAGFSPVRQAWSHQLARATAASTPPSSPGWGSRSCTRSARPSRSRARPPATWRASSGPGARTPTA